VPTQGMFLETITPCRKIDMKERNQKTFTPARWINILHMYITARTIPFLMFYQPDSRFSHYLPAWFVDQRKRNGKKKTEPPRALSAILMISKSLFPSDLIGTRDSICNTAWRSKKLDSGGEVTVFVNGPLRYHVDNEIQKLGLVLYMIDAHFCVII
jgi:uncharacterized membrane protein